MSLQTVYVVDDDDSVREALRWLLDSKNYSVRTFASAEEFLKAFDRSQSGCLVLDYNMPGMNGIELQEKLAGDRLAPPIIFLTGHGNVPLAERAMKSGAFGFLEKPLAAQTLQQRVKDALALDRRRREKMAEHAELLARLETLTACEREVLDLIVDGKTSKKIGVLLHNSHRTIDNHRTVIRRKMHAKNTQEVIRMALLARELSSRDFS